MIVPDWTLWLALAGLFILGCVLWVAEVLNGWEEEGPDEGASGPDWHGPGDVPARPHPPSGGPALRLKTPEGWQELALYDPVVHGECIICERPAPVPERVRVV